MVGIKRTFINSRADFFTVLADVIGRTKKLVAAEPGYAPFESIDMQLDAISRWTANDREPTVDERKRITIGRIIVRELSPAPTEELAEYTKRLTEVGGYFQDWMSDAELATFDDSAPLSDFAPFDR
jgi:hypothetical protein